MIDGLDAELRVDYFTYVYGRLEREVHEDVGSDACFKLVDEWVRKCNDEHACYQGGKADLPTRVLDVGPKDPVLLIANGTRDRYVTLSHCWGGEQPLVTTTATLAERRAGIPMMSLPPLYRDAVAVTRRLGIRYLWIDSLCILQDSKTDWAEQASRMGDIYRMSYLTLYALESSNCHETMLVRRQPVVPLTPGDGTAQPKDLYGERRREHIFRTAPLCQRAWALQERLLSPRLLYYSHHELFWECLACTAREGSHRAAMYKPTPYRYESYQCPEVRKLLLYPQEENPVFPVSLPSDWQIIVSEYTRCHLTFPSDTLPAISGLATAFQKNTGYTYVAGLWQQDLVNGLLWFCPPEQDYSAVDREAHCDLQRPSWSWIACQRAVQFKSLRDEGELARPRDAELEFVSAEVELLGPDPMGEIISAALVVEAFFFDIRLESQAGSRNCSIYDSDGEKFGNGVLDAIDSHPGVRRQCAAMYVRQKRQDIFKHEKFTTYFLIVDAVANHGQEEEQWRRLGLAWSFRFIPTAPKKSVIQLV